MVTRKLAPKWTPLGFAQRLRLFVKQPSDIWLALQIGYFMWRAPALLQQRHLRKFLGDLRMLPRPAASDTTSSLERIRRLRGLCLRLPPLRSRDTCYVRALTLYRFLDGGARAVNIHFGIEEMDGPRERLRGHAWVSVDGQLFEAPPRVLNARLREVPLMPADSSQ